MAERNEVDSTQGPVNIVNKIADNQRSDAINTIHDLLFSKAADAMGEYKKTVANTFFDEPTETETEVTDETDNGND